MSINLRQLRSLVAIARLGNFTRAAESLHISQPALTVQMHELEKSLGIRLLDRNTRSVRLTSLGSQVVPSIERALQEIDTAIAGTKLTTESIGVVTIAALPCMCANMVPLAIARFSKQYPGITVRLREADSQKIAASIIEDEADLGVGVITQPHAKLETTPLITDNLVIACPAHHPLLKKRSIAPLDLVDYPIISFESRNSVRRLLDSALHTLGAHQPSAYEVSFISTAIGMVRAGLGISILSSSALEQAVMTGLQARPIKGTGLRREIVVVRKKGRTLSPAAESLLQAIYFVRDTRDSYARSGTGKIPRRARKRSVPPSPETVADC